MKTAVKNICMVLSMTLLSCNNQEPDTSKIKNDIKTNSGIAISSFKLLKADSESAIGDYSETYELKIDSVKFQDIINQIKESKYYDSTYDYNLSNTVLIDDRRWVKMPYGYGFEYFIKGAEEMVFYEVDTSDFTMRCSYIQE